jgi:arabinogalactan oligomer/maltooligosaccharide transport system permease protein
MRPPRFFLTLAAIVAFIAMTFGDVARAHADESIALWHAYRGDEETALIELVHTYEREHPGVHIDLLPIPFDAYASKLRSAIPYGQGPDLFIEAHERLGSYLRDQLVVPLTGDASAALPNEDVALYDAVSVRAITLNGSRYAVPLANKCLALYVNDALLPHVPDTLEEILATKKSLAPGVYALAYDTTSAFFHAPFLHAFGGEMIDAEGHFAFVGEKAEKSLDFVRDLVRSHQVPEEPSGALIKELFVSNRAATVISGPWFASDLKSDVKYSVHPLPRLAATNAMLEPFLTVEGVFVTPDGAHKNAALKFARWIGGEESAQVRAIVGHQVVARTSVWSDPRVAADRNLRAFHDAVAHSIPMPTSAAMRVAWVPANQAILKVLRGEADAHDALIEAQHRFEDVMRPPPPPANPIPMLILLGAFVLALIVAAIRNAMRPGFRDQLRRSLPAYRYVAHAVIAIFALVVLPLIAGAITSLFVGPIMTNNADGTNLTHYVGLANYISILTARGGPLLAHGSFYLTLLVTILWTLLNVSLHVIIGLTLGIALSRPFLKLRAFYRVLLILPWAVPSYVTALAWKGMFHRQFGAINAILKIFGVPPVSWFSHFATAFTANLATNVWLGFPFMMVVTLGALTSIPKDVLEAAEVDGASRWQRFRLVTLPLLKPSLLPSIVLGAVWTFNMFNVVFLVSGGEPDETTDILVSEAYRWAFTRDAQYGYAAAYAVLIFVILAFGSRMAARKFASSSEAEAA